MRHDVILQVVFGVLILASDVRFLGVGGHLHRAHSHESAIIAHWDYAQPPAASRRTLPWQNQRGTNAIPPGCAFAFSALQPALSSVGRIRKIPRPGTCGVSMSVQGSQVNVGSSPRALEPTLRSPLNFLKLSRSEDGSEYELCTGSITMERDVGNNKVESVELVATVHLGEEDYFRGIQSYAASRDRVLFELVAGPDDLWTDAAGRQRLNRSPTPSDAQLRFARRYELQHQLAMINYTCSDTWQLADLGRETILRLQHQELRRLEKSFVEGVQGDALRMAARRLGREATTVWFLRGGDGIGGPPRVRDRAAIAAGVALGLVLPAPEEGVERTAVLYGVLHMGQMYEKLLQNGFRPAPTGLKWRRAWSVPAVPKETGAARPWLLGAWVLVWLGALDYSDVAAHAFELSDCLRFGAQSVVWSMWPHTEIQVPVTQFLQCPSDHVDVDIARTLLLYAARHAWLYWTLQHILFR